MAKSDVDSSSGTSLFASDADPSSTCHSTPHHATSPEGLSPELRLSQPPVTPDRLTGHRTTEDENTPTQASVAARLNGYVRSGQNNNDDTPGSQDPFDDDATKFVQTPFLQTLRDGVERRRIQASSSKPTPKPSPEMLKNFVFIFPSSEHANHTREVFTEPNHGFLFSSRLNGSAERQFYVFLPSVEQPLCFYSNKLAVLSYLLRWLETCGSNKPLALRIKCTDSSDDDCIEDVLQILFGSYHAHKWRDIDLQLNDLVSERLLGHLVQATNLVYARLDTRNCSTRSSFALFSRLEGLPNFQELVYHHDPVHFFLSKVVSQLPIWSQLVHIDIGARLDETECVVFLAQCVQASSITLRWLMNADDTDTLAHAKRSVITLPRLRFFDIVTSHYDTTLVLRYFTFPALETLGFAMEFSGWKTSNRLAKFLLRSNAPLSKINIFDAFLSPMGTAKVLLAVVIGTATPLDSVYQKSPGVNELDEERQQPIERTVVECLGIFTSQIKKGGNLVEAWNQILEGLKDTGNDEYRGLVVPPLDVFGGSWRGGSRRKRIGWGDRPLFL